MMKTATLLLTLMIATAGGFGAPFSIDRIVRETDLQDQIDRQQNQIGMATAYNARLEGILLRKGFPLESLIGPLSFTQRMDRRLPTMHFDGTPLRQALGAVARNAGVRIVFDEHALRAAGVNDGTLVTAVVLNASTRSALAAILKEAGGAVPLQSLLRDDAVAITAIDRDAPQPVITRTYDVTDIIKQIGIADFLGQLIINTVAPDSWKDNGGESGLLRILLGKQLIVTQTADNQIAIAHLLDELSDDKRIARRRAAVDEQENQILALAVQTDKLIARCRSVGAGFPLPAGKAMDAQIADMEFVNAPLGGVIERLGHECDQEIDVNWTELASAGITKDRPITFGTHRQTLAGTLRKLLGGLSSSETPIEFKLAEDAIVIATRAHFDKATITRIYDVRDLLATTRNWNRTIEALESDITRRFEPDTWKDAGGTAGSLRDLQCTLIVTQTSRVQAEIKAYIDYLRQNPEQMQNFGVLTGVWRIRQ